MLTILAETARFARLNLIPSGGEGTGSLRARVTAVCWVDHLAD